MKLLDVSRFNKVLKSFTGDDGNHVTIMKLNFIQYIYHIFRLILIALIITYFIGCIFFFLSTHFNLSADIEAGATFVLANNLDGNERWSDTEKLILICYFALTTFSTVGYGDLFPVS